MKYDIRTELIVRVIVTKGDSVLLCRNIEMGHRFLPGGHVEFGDTLLTTLEKEMNEELGLEPSELHDIKFVHYLENSFEDKGETRYELNMIFTARIDEGRELVSQEDHIGFDWVPMTELDDSGLLPTAIIPIIKSI